MLFVQLLINYVILTLRNIMLFEYLTLGYVKNLTQNFNKHHV